MVRKHFSGIIYILKLTLILLVILLQLGLVFALSFYANEYLSYYYFFEYFLVLTFVLIINYQDIRVSYKLAWFVFLALFPPEAMIFYTIYYCFLRINIYANKHNKIQAETKTLELQNEDIVSKVSSKTVKQYLDLIYINSRYPVFKNTETTYLPVGEDYQREMIAELKKAEKYIFMQYFIIVGGEMLDEIMEVLIEKAKNGVEVYFSYDSFGSITTRPRNFDDYCEENNIHLLPFNKNLSSLYQFISFRDHRKITVVDGVVAFTGGINIGDEYINKIIRFGHWKDMGIKIYGDGARNLSMIFMKAWNLSVPNTFDYEKYLENATPHNIVNDDLVVAYDDGPFSDDDIAEKVYLRMITNAKKYVYITTPYLIPSIDILAALKLASNSGIDVKILTPGIPDKKVVFECSRSHYSELIAAGVKIFEYTPGFIHGKTCVIDDEISFVGSVNLDFRSLIWNYECGAWVYSNPLANSIREDLENCFSKSHEVTREDIDSTPFYLKLFRSAVNLFAPLL